MKEIDISLNDCLTNEPMNRTYNIIHGNSHYFTKRVFNFRSFMKTVQSIIRNRRIIMDTMKSKRISYDFSERIMLAVTAVNGCRICEWAHTKMAIESGCTDEEIKNILDLDFIGLKKEEITALAFAQHFAESKENPSKTAVINLVKEYGNQKAVDIINHCRMITIGNLMGNTIDAFNSRINGIQVVDGSFFFEFLVYLFGGLPLKLMSSKMA
ncbi:carboxymuconolactone decarboxylase family protein [Promethearchaeum syntrophicum]|uniref:Carboxymuconolactone decarboxylase family protein n=1 Tax=Promethearchaeum syntrophicum TaxID=2594042 RepID=A0A5B9DD67_9ARCH|nr:carboxymuconolactone decarboxylase family protein [Candidatus Prometheoarchaeum syntrophicum]QEE17062.1 Carboxymuconolactone decarboxylase family protein [Candidatus Prometheoarchaeum syntrophicum]